MWALMDPQTLTAPPNALRLDALLAQRYPDCSRTYFQRLIADGFVLVDGERAKKRTIPDEGASIEVCFQLTPEISLAPERIDFEILYEDEHLIAINKPAGLVTHPAPGHWSGTFVNGLLFHCQTLQPDGTLRPGIVHRLDKETSGVLVAAKTSVAHAKLIELFASRKVEKSYLAICVGKPAAGRVSAPIGRHPKLRKQMAVVESGKEAITDIEVLAGEEWLTLVRARPYTGRTHQIRVHLKHLGAPVLGDKLYGKADTERHMLHAHKLALPHPITQVRLELEAPLPQDFLAYKFVDRVMSKNVK